MANTLTKVDQFKGFINSQTIKAQVYVAPHAGA